MSKIKVKDFLDLLNSQVNKAIYVWGADGEILSAMDDPIEWITDSETSASYAQRAIALYNKRKKNGIYPIRAFDCSGFIYWALKELGIQKSDISSRGLMGMCTKIDRDDIREGDLCFMFEDRDGDGYDRSEIYHIGAYIGNGQVTECRGRDYGVVVTDVDLRRFNAFGRLKAFANILPDEEGEKSEPTKPQNAVEALGSVNVRVGGSSKYAKIGNVRKGNILPLRGIAGSGWYAVTFAGKEGYISNREDLTRLVYNADFDKQSEAAPESNNPYKMVKVVGGSVNVRSGDGTTYPSIGIARRGQVVPYFGAAPSGWHIIDWYGRQAYISNDPKYTEVITT